ncbi:MAG: MarR family transcriptional regulator [candidate division KSB1 bacterium]|nr:MarR family transcriptional regulator [candidate division KSB1 bacterium]
MNEDPIAARIAELVPVLMGAFHDLRPEQAEEEDLTMRQFQALMLVYAHGQLTLGELCTKLRLAPSTGSELVDRLITKGYVNKSGGQQDRRQVLLRLTDEGFRVLQERRRLLTERLSRFLSHFTPEDREQLLASFENLAALILKYVPSGQAPSPHGREKPTP